MKHQPTRLNVVHPLGKCASCGRKLQKNSTLSSLFSLFSFPIIPSDVGYCKSRLVGCIILVSMAGLKYNVVFYPEPEGGFTAIVPALPGCVTYGKNLNTAKKMASDAISAYLKSLKKHKEKLPNDDSSFITSIDVQIPINA